MEDIWAIIEKKIASMQNNTFFLQKVIQHYDV